MSIPGPDLKVLHMASTSGLVKLSVSEYTELTGGGGGGGGGGRAGGPVGGGAGGGGGGGPAATAVVPCVVVEPGCETTMFCWVVVRVVVVPVVPVPGCCSDVTVWGRVG